MTWYCLGQLDQHFQDLYLIASQFITNLAVQQLMPVIIVIAQQMMMVRVLLMMIVVCVMAMVRHVDLMLCMILIPQLLGSNFQWLQKALHCLLPMVVLQKMLDLKCQHLLRPEM